MGLKFKIVETSYSKEADEERYQKVKQDYIKGLREKELKTKYNFGTKYYFRSIVPRLKKEGVYKVKKHPKRPYLRQYHPNKSGIFRVWVDKREKITRYRYNSREKGNYYSITTDNLDKLKKRVIEKGGYWYVYDEDKARSNGLTI